MSRHAQKSTERVIQNDGSPVQWSDAEPFGWPSARFDQVALATLRLSSQRLRAGWYVSLALLFGMVCVITFLGVIPMYINLTDAVQAQGILNATPSTGRNIQVDVTIPSLYLTTPQQIDALVARDVHTRLPNVIAGSTEYVDLTTPLALMSVNGAPVNQAFPEYPIASGAQVLPIAFDYRQSLPHMDVLAGRAPQETPPGTLPEVMITPALRAVGIQPGMLLQLVSPSFPATNIEARVVGVWFPKNEQDPYWNGKGFDTVILPKSPPHAPGAPVPPPPSPQYPLLFARQTLIRLFSYPPAPGRQTTGAGLHYIFFIASDRITVANAQTIQQNLVLMRSALDVDVPGQGGAGTVAVTTQLRDLLQKIGMLLSGFSAPLYSVVTELTALALLFIFAMARLFVGSQSGEIATLKSRGASTLQVLLVFLSQGILLAIVALVVGMAAAGALSLALVRFFVPLGQTVLLSPTYLAQIASPHDALPPLIGAGLGLAALLVAAYQSAQRDVLVFRHEQGRGTSAPFWKRYYLDLGLAALCVAGYLELEMFGSISTRSLLSNAGRGSSSDLVQLFTPSLVLITGALIMQRILPVPLRWGARIAEHGRSATPILTFSQVEYAWGAFQRVTLLLTLAVGLGIFALTFQTTIAHDAADNAYYQTGADERVIIKPPTAGTQSTLGYAARFAKLPGVQEVSPLFRGVAFSSPNQGGQNVDVLGVDSSTYLRTGTWRSDYSEQSLASLLKLLTSRGMNAGTKNTPMMALVDTTFANDFNLQPGARFQLVPQEAGTANGGTTSFVVGAIIHDFPTLYDEYPSGYIVTNVTDYLNALANPNLGDYTVNGPNEFLLRTSADAQEGNARAKALQDPNFFVQTTLDARALTTEYRSDPLAAGMSGLLLLGAGLALLLALVGILTQATVVARQRSTQFAILRTLGLSASALVRVLVGEQALVYLLGTLSGVALSALLSIGSLPFLGFSTAAYSPPAVGTPPSQLTLNLSASLVYLIALLGIFMFALVVTAGIARGIGLGRALRIGED